MRLAALDRSVTRPVNQRRRTAQKCLRESSVKKASDLFMDAIRFLLADYTVFPTEAAKIELHSNDDDEADALQKLNEEPNLVQ